MDSIDELLKTIDDSINEFIKTLPDSQNAAWRKVVALLKQLDVKNDQLKNNVANWRAVARIKKELESAILNHTYTKSVADFLGAYDLVSEIQNGYFTTLSDAFSPMKILEELKKQNIETTAAGLTEQGIGESVILPIKNILQTNIASGGSYADLTEQLRTEMLGNEELDGSLLRYARTYAYDSINQFSASYTESISADLDLDWFRVIGSLIKTSRPICVAMVHAEYFHRSQIPQLLKGNVWGKQTPLGSDGNPLGFINGTNESNYMVYRNGWFCGHLFIPVAESSVPKNLSDEIG